MRARVFPVWAFLVLAALIAALAFGIAQVLPGAGIWFVAGATILWFTYLGRRFSHG